MKKLINSLKLIKQSLEFSMEYNGDLISKADKYVQAGELVKSLDKCIKDIKSL